MDGEEWENIPRLSGYFLISNIGRIKRLQYEMQYRNGAIYVKPEKIIKPSIVRQPNNFKRDFTSFLACSVSLNGTRHNMMVTRMVYYCFVLPFDLDDPDVVILCRDGDNFNVQPFNLALATTDEKQQRTVERKRFRSPFNDISQEVRMKQRQAITLTSNNKHLLLLSAMIQLEAIIDELKAGSLAAEPKGSFVAIKVKTIAGSPMGALCRSLANLPSQGKFAVWVE